MKRTQIYLTDKQMVLVEKKAQEIGISKSELIRRVLDDYIKESSV